MNRLFEFVMRPWEGPSPWPGLVFTALLTSGLLVLLFRFSADQAGILRSRNRFIARAMELLLFQHDLRTSFAATGSVLLENLRYIACLARPIAVSLVPLLLVFVQLATWFDWRPFHPGEATVLSLQLRPDVPALTTPVAIAVSDGLRVDSPPVRIAALNEVSWRIACVQPGRHWAELSIAGATERKEILVDPKLIRVSPTRSTAGFWSRILSPGEPPLPATSPLARIQIEYVPRIVWLGDWQVHWIIVVVVLIMVFSLLLGRVFGVRIA